MRRTPYATFERCRLPVRIAFYAFIAVHIGAIIWFGFLNAQALKDWMPATSKGVGLAVCMECFSRSRENLKKIDDRYRHTVFRL